ncbi:MAG: DUF3224 domain-containing protein [Thermoleophilaceae bacterium]
MADHAEGQFKIQSWDEKPYGERLARASVEQAFSGDIVGEGSVEWLMCYREDKTADFVGLQRVEGKIGERSGSVVLKTIGTFDGAEARADLSVVPGSGTDGLEGLRGQGGFVAPHGSTASFTLDYDFE